MEGAREVVAGRDGTPLGLLTAGSGPPLLLVHGGLSGRSRFAPLWAELTDTFRVTAFDRRGRGSSGDGPVYDIAREYEDLAAVAEHLADRAGRAVDVFGHSIGGVVVLGAAGRGAPLRRLALYEPPGPPTVTPAWLGRVRGLIDAGRPGPAVVSFLTEVVGLDEDQVRALREAPPRPGDGAADDVLAIAARTLVREAEALAGLDLGALASAVTCPVLLLHGTASPPWAAQVVQELAGRLPDVEVGVLAGEGHEGVDTAAAEVAGRLRRFLGAG